LKIVYDTVLVAIGRKGNINSLNLQKAGVKFEASSNKVFV
jgi:pyruvate/2-oxoglutarate dehydrogenase complex dihydrolipoamide dehydrogenase (E3) component